LSFKLFKDPIYGYVEIDSEIVRSIIDTACFQRLRNIRQTSYAPLYPASFHNRFIHSIGVYHLGRKVFDSVHNSLGSLEQTFLEELDNIKRLFELACLLHDVGHAPFSHTGERFFLADAANPPAIYAKLSALVSDPDFSDDFDYYCNNGKVAAPHEIMSCIVALEVFKDHFRESSERAFFSRCITGFKYRNAEKANSNILNCFIELLNSPIIDVDRLDYIIRDAKTTGFQSVSIDYERLLEGIRIIDNNGSKYLAYHKSALSVIENVIYAHDTERKWIQNHPVILYEHFLLQHAMRNIDKYFALSESGSRFFSLDSLSRNGGNFGSKGKISLLADEDVLYIMKNVISDDLMDEYFFRGSRRHPLWKSEAEYRALFDNELGKNKLDEFEITFKEIEKYLIDYFSIPVINEKVLEHIEREERKIIEKKSTIPDRDYKNLMDGMKKIEKWVDCLSRIASENDILFDFVIISANKFKSGFLKQDLEKIRIVFPSLKLISSIKDVSTILTSEKTRDSFFYLFYRSKDHDGNDKEVPVKAIAEALAGELFMT